MRRKKMDVLAVEGVADMIRLHVDQGAYYDSVTLMLITRDVKAVEGVEEVYVGMGTDLNKEIAQGIGLVAPGFEEITANDFFVALKSDKEEVMESVLEKVKELLNAKKEAASANYYPPNLKSALNIDSKLNMAIVSVPGQHAAEVAEECLDNNINVLIFSDNMSIEDEVRLKKKAVEKELLLMGPDCGTAIINQIPLAFANVVRKGDIGVVAASGTGTQEVTTIIDQLGKGVSQVIGTGGRDLSLAVGGLMFIQALEALKRDDSTKVIVLISKPPAKEIADKVLKLAKDCGKPVVVCFIGGNPADANAMGLYGAVSLEDGARKAVALSEGKTPVDFNGFSESDEEILQLVKGETASVGKEQRYLRGLYTGGTLCDEAMKLLTDDLKGIYSNIPLEPQFMVENKDKSQEHTCLDFGNDEFTVGRPHPMIDPSLREERIRKEAADPETGVILLDCVIGYGAHKDPATELGKTIVEAKKLAADNGRYLPVVVSVCGTEGDPQVLSASRKVLKESGAVVMNSNAQAVKLVGRILEAMNEGGR